MADVTRDGLSDEQRAVVDCDDRAIVVRASAGSGKTEVVAQRVERLLTDGGDPGFRILALSYTRRAAGELRARFASRLGDAGRRVQTDTIHGFAQALLLQYGTWIGLPTEPEVVVSDIDRVDLWQAWRLARGEQPVPDAREKLLELDLCRARGEQSALTEEWHTALAEAGALDYESMLVRAAELLQVPSVRRLVSRLYRHVIVDEAQNLTVSQYELLVQLVGEPDDSGRAAAMLVGDDKQSIVGFAGASAAHMSVFASSYDAREFRLSCNFRSAEHIVQLVAEVARVLGDEAAEPQSYAAAGSVAWGEWPDERAEASAVAAWVVDLTTHGLPPVALAPHEPRGVRPQEIGVLARSAAALRTVQSALEAAGVPVAVATHADDWLMSDAGQLAWLVGTFRPDSAVSRRRVGRHPAVTGGPGSRQELHEALAASSFADLACLALAESPQDFIQETAALDVQDEDWFRDQQEMAAAWGAFCDAESVSDRTWSRFVAFVSRWQSGDDKQPGVRLQTVHKAQGREFKAVAVVGLNDGQFPDFRARDAASRQAELRAFYVAVSRPSRLLLLTRPMSIAGRKGAWPRDASPYLRLAQSTAQRLASA